MRVNMSIPTSRVSQERVLCMCRAQRANQTLSFNSPQQTAPTMDMDIDDILADLNRDNVAHDIDDLRSLARLWVAERVAPELMPWPEDLIQRTMNRIAKQVLHGNM
jgi:hypothetical protein